MLGDQMGFHSFWTVEHHFLEEYSHCSNPEVLYGAIAARTENIRIGYGVRLLPKPYNHPIRTAESVAVLDLITDGRVEFGTGRSSTRAEIEGFDIDPTRHARDVERGARTHRRARGRTTSTSPTASTGRWRAAARAPQAAAAAAPADLGRDEQPRRPLRDRQARHRAAARSRSASRPRQLAERIALYRKGRRVRRSRSGKFVNDTAATFTMVHCADTNEKARRGRRGIVRVVPEATAAVTSRRSRSGWRSRAQDLGNYQYTADMHAAEAEGRDDHLTIDYLYDTGCRRRRRPRPVHRVGEALRGRRLRPAVLPLEPVQDPARQGHAVDRAASASTSSPSSSSRPRTQLASTNVV